MRLRFLSVLFLSIVLDLQATGQPQSMVLNAFRSKCDTLATLIQKRTSVTAVINLKSVERRNGYLDFRFTQGMGDIPWRKEDLAWLRRTLHEISPAEFAHYKIGNLYCGRTPLTQLALPAPGNDGRPSEHNWRTHDPLDKYVPIVRNEEELKYRKGLSGRQIALWQSHGYYYDAKTCRWKWQRAPLFTTVEDLYTQSYVLPFLIPMLENAGAYVMTPRERDTQKHEVIIDNDPAFSGLTQAPVSPISRECIPAMTILSLTAPRERPNARARLRAMLLRHGLQIFRSAENMPYMFHIFLFQTARSQHITPSITLEGQAIFS